MGSDLLAAVTAAASHADVSLLFVVLAVIAFAVAVYMAFRGAVVEAVASALIGVIILVFAA
jgi:hypothetical protein